MAINRITISEDTPISGKEAEAYFTIGNERHQAMWAKTAELKSTLKKSKLPILGRRSDASKVNGLEHTLSVTGYYVTSLFRKAIIDYQNGGVLPRVDWQITNEDETSGIGRQTVIASGCLLDEVIMAKFDITTDDPIEEELNFTVESVSLPEEFTPVQGTF